MRRLVFDSDTWAKTGDIGNNSQFWKPATIFRKYDDDGNSLVDVVFDNGRVSCGHFFDATREISEKNKNVVARIEIWVDLICQRDYLEDVRHYLETMTLTNMKELKNSSYQPSEKEFIHGFKVQANVGESNG